MDQGLTKTNTVKNLVENLLFMSEEPLTVKRLSESLPYSKEEIAAALDALQADYEDRGIKLRFIQNGWRLATDPSLNEEIESFFSLQRRKRLSRAALETLAIIAYNQPITRAEIESIRGLQTSGTLQTLQDAMLIRVAGQRNTVGNPYLYGTTDEFLQYFGLADPSELPKLEFTRNVIAPDIPRAEEIVECDVPEKPEEDTIIKSVDFGLVVDEIEVVSHVQQKGA